uniref:Uncharacterized protein n=1 Tax=Neolamprologus brichardi TaxID=32507 RepID=A0A3Q4HZE2_NEOBR
PRSVRLNSFCKCVCVWLSAKVFDIFIRLSHDLGLNQGFRKRGSSLSLVFLHSPPLHQVTNPQQGRGSSHISESFTPTPTALLLLVSVHLCMCVVCLSEHEWRESSHVVKVSPLSLSDPVHPTLSHKRGHLQPSLSQQSFPNITRHPTGLCLYLCQTQWQQSHIST